MYSGIITSAKMFSSGYGGAVFAGLLMLVIGLMFGALAALDFVMLLRVSRQIQMFARYKIQSVVRLAMEELHITVHS